jgi:hypothetical protein
MLLSLKKLSESEHKIKGPCRILQGPFLVFSIGESEKFFSILIDAILSKMLVNISQLFKVGLSL